MTIRKRLFVSNILMIVVPVAITALIALACVGTIWAIVANGHGLGFEDSESFYSASKGISDMAVNILDNASRETQIDELKEMGGLLDKSAMSLSVDAGESNIYHYGSVNDQDTVLLNAVYAMGGEGFVSCGSRELYVRRAVLDNTDYSIMLFSTPTELSYGTLKVTIALAAIILLFGVFLSILFTNRFLTKFVFQKIEHPLDILSDGVRQISDGNLEHRIIYEPKDEFAPVCADFNEMAERLKASVELSQHHEQSRRELLAGISHDLRSPLTSIRAYVEGLLDGVAKTPEAQRGYLETIKNKSEDIDHMVEKIFLFSKMELGECPDKPRLLHLDDELRQIICAVGAEYKEKGLDISTDELVPATILADPELLNRVVFNIIENSLRYKNKEVGKLDISLEEENGGYHLSLCDDGPGVPADALPHLFEVFYRSDPSRQSPNKGSGLGLAIAASAVQKMNGRIAANICENGGLEIAIWLPEQGE